MRHWLLILSAIVSAALQAATHNLYVNVSDTAISLSGEVPAGLSTSCTRFQQTHYKERLTSGDSLVLELNGMPRSYLLSAAVSVHSNKSGGAGSLRLQNDGLVVWAISNAKFNSSDWNGAYTNAYTTISHDFPQSLQSIGLLRLTIVASENSLYFQSLSICYETPDTLDLQEQNPVNHTITFRHDNSVVTEDTPGAGILLPCLSDTLDNWHFQGWTTTPVSETSSQPRYYRCGTRYYPRTDCDLYALYCNEQDAPEWIPQDTSRRSGDYALAYYSTSLDGCMATSAWKSQKLKTQPCTIFSAKDGLYYLNVEDADPAGIYRMIFQGADSLRIYSTTSNCYVSPAGNKDSTLYWRWLPAANNTLFLYSGAMHADSSFTALCHRLSGTDGSIYFQTISSAYYNPAYPEFLLFPAAALQAKNTPVSYLTISHQQTSLNTLSAQHTINWDSPIQLYSLHGQLQFSGLTSPQQIPHGMWILRQGHLTTKICK